MNNWLTIQEAAKFLEVNHQTVRRYVLSGDLEARQSKIGLRRIYVSRDSAEQFLKKLKPA